MQEQIVAFFYNCFKLYDIIGPPAPFLTRLQLNKALTVDVEAAESQDELFDAQTGFSDQQFFGQHQLLRQQQDEHLVLPLDDDAFACAAGQQQEMEDWMQHPCS